MSGLNGFEVEYDKHDKVWRAKLPHQCDAWVIAEDANPLKVLEELRQFITEAQEIEAKLVDVCLTQAFDTWRKEQ